MADRHGTQVSVTLSTTPTKVTKFFAGTPTAGSPGNKWMLMINEAAGAFYVTMNASANTGPKIGTVAATDHAVPAGIFSASEDVWLVATGSTAVKYVVVLLAN